MIRFSLTTLLLVAFWIAALMLVWAWREPWALSSAPRRQAATQKNSLSDRRALSLRISNQDLSLVIEETENGIRTNNTIGEIPAIEQVTDSFLNEYETNVRGIKELSEFTQLYPKYGFLDADTIAFQLKAQSPTKLFVRRQPEWWWGHFYRPEVWLALALTSVLIWRGIRAKWQAAPQA